MSRLVFENSKFALGFAGVTIAGAALFAFTSGSSSLLGGSDDETPTVIVEEDGEDGETEIVAKNEVGGPTEELQPEGFATDEELINDTLGFEPSPGEIAEIGETEGADESDTGGFGGFGDFDDDYGSSIAPRPRSAPSASGPRGAPDGDGGGSQISVGRRDIPDPVIE